MFYTSLNDKITSSHIPEKLYFAYPFVTRIFMRYEFLNVLPEKHPVNKM